MEEETQKEVNIYYNLNLTWHLVTCCSISSVVEWYLLLEAPVKRLDPPCRFGSRDRFMTDLLVDHSRFAHERFDGGVAHPRVPFWRMGIHVRTRYVMPCAGISRWWEIEFGMTYQTDLSTVVIIRYTRCSFIDSPSFRFHLHSFYLKVWHRRSSLPRFEL